MVAIMPSTSLVMPSTLVYSHGADIAAVAGDSHVVQLLPAVVLHDLRVVQLWVRHHPDKEGSFVLQSLTRFLLHCLVVIVVYYLILYSTVCPKGLVKRYVFAYCSG